MRLLPALLLLPVLLGCASSPAWRRAERPERFLRSGDGFRKGDSAAIVACNTYLYTTEREFQQAAQAGYPGLDGPIVAPPQELRVLTDALFATYVEEFQQLPGLEWLPVARVESNQAYRRLPHPDGADSLGRGLVLGQDSSLTTAPVGLQHYLILRSEYDLQTARGSERALERITRAGRQLEELNYLAKALGVDAVVVISNVVHLRPHPRLGWVAELESAEVQVLSADSKRDFSYGQVLFGPGLAADATLPRRPAKPGPEAVTLMAAHNYRPLDPVRNRWWRSLSPQVREAASRFREDLADQRR